MSEQGHSSETPWIVKQKVVPGTNVQTAREGDVIVDTIFEKRRDGSLAERSASDDPERGPKVYQDEKKIGEVLARVGLNSDLEPIEQK